MKQVIENINLHKLKSADSLKDQQIAYIPRLNKNQIECMVQSYLIDGKRTIIDQARQVCFKLKYLNFKSMPPRKSITFKNGIWDMRELIDSNVILPFMLFINGLFVTWDRIRIAIGQENYFLVVRCDSMYLDNKEDIKFAQIITLPSHTSLIIDYSRYYMDENTLFAFNERGDFDVSGIFKIINTTGAHHMMFKYWSSLNGVNAVPIFYDTSIKLTDENVVLFIDGRLATGDKEKIKKAHDGEYKNQETGAITPCLDFETSDEELEPNPKIRFDSTLLTIGDGTNESGKMYSFGVFVNHKYTSTADNISRVSLEGLAPLIHEQNAGENNPEYLQDLQKPFEMAMDRTKAYDENVANAIKTMLSYNPWLFNSVYKDKSNLIIEEYDGFWALSNMNEDGVIQIPRQHSSTVDEYILMMVNGTIYQYYYMCKYVANKYIIPIQGINPEDTIELLRFRNVNNGVTNLTVNKEDGFRPYSSEIINEEMVLFSTETDLEHFDFPADGLQHFPVEYSLETNSDGEIQITLTNEFYYGKPLKVAYKNRFQHFWFNLTETTDKFTVNLGDKFMYCNDYSKYLVFYNGKRLGSDHFRLTLPVRPTTPFYKFDIYLTMPIKNGDRLDVVYVPSLMQDVIMTPEVPTSGDIVVDRSAINHGLTTDLYMVWINGKKIPASRISDIDSTHMRIITDEQSTETVCITKYIPDIDAITNIFKDNEALWDKIMKQLTNEEIYKLLGIYGDTLTNTEESVYADAVNIRAIMFELIREQFMMNPRVDITGPFIYDYQDVDQTAIEGYDSGDNAILPVADANRSDNLDDVERPWP